MLRSDPVWLELASRWTKVHQEISRLEQEAADLRARLIELAGESDCSGGGIRLACSTRKGAINYSAIAALKDIDLEPYRKPSSKVWTLTCCRDRV